MTVVDMIMSVEEYCNAGDYESASKYLKDNNISERCEYLARKYELNETEKQELEMLIKILQKIYNNSGLSTGVPDEIYDMLYEKYLTVFGVDEVGAPVDDDDKVYHKYPQLRGTLDKIHFIRNSEKGKNENRKSLEDWLVSIKNKVPLFKYDTTIRLFLKFDGCSGIAENDSNGIPYRWLSRGYTVDNSAKDLSKYLIDESNNYEYMVEDEKITRPFGVKNEIIITRDNFRKLLEIPQYSGYKTMRSAVSGILNNDKVSGNVAKLLTPVPLQYVEEGEEIPKIPSIVDYGFPTATCNIMDFDEVHKCIDKLILAADELGYPIDGIVFRFIDKDLQKALGRDGAINKYEVAYKLPPKEKKTILLDVDFSVGSLGTITPVAKVEPVNMDGPTIRSISLGSIDRMRKLHLRRYQEVIIKHDVIPYLYINDSCEINTDEPEIIIPHACPICGQLLEEDPILMCVNKQCPSRVIGTIVNYLNKLNILNISEGTITKLVNAGLISNIPDLYNLKNLKNTIIELEGFGELSFQVMIEDLERKKSIYDYELLGSIGIVGMGRKIFEKVMKEMSIDQLFEVCEMRQFNKLVDIPGIADKSARKIIYGVLENKEIIRKLMKELNIQRYEEKEYLGTVCFTGFRDKAMEKKFEDIGFKTVNKVNKKLTLLVVKSLSDTSSKITDAKRYGCLIIDKDHVDEMISHVLRKTNNSDV